MLTTRLALIPLSVLVATLAGCGNGGSSAPQPQPAPPTKTADAAPAPSPEGNADMKHDDHAEGDDHHHGPSVALGEQTVGGFVVRASRDGEITAGGDVPIDAWITGGEKVATVRFWIGTEDAKGSMKAKAELEKDNWHVHVEVPSPMPEGSKLWIEVEAEGGKRTTVGFDLKAAA
jgi:hypothetical protein